MNNEAIKNSQAATNAVISIDKAPIFVHFHAIIGHAMKGMPNTIASAGSVLSEIKNAKNIRQNIEPIIIASILSHLNIYWL